MNDDIQHEWLVSLRATYLATAPEKIDALDRSISGLEVNPENQSHYRRLRRLLHNLIGSGASYGYPEVTDIAVRMRESLGARSSDEKPVDEAVLGVLRQELDHLKQAFSDSRI